MKLLVVGRDETEQARLALVLKQAGYDVAAARPDATARPDALAGVHAALVDIDSPAESWLELVRHYRATAPGPHRLHVVMLGNGIPEAYLIRAYEAGVDADIRRPFSREFLLARMITVGRVMTPGGAAPRPIAVVPVAPAAAGPFELVLRSSAWRGAAATLQATAGTFLTLDVGAGVRTLDDAPLDVACCVHMSDVQHDLQLRVAVGADAKSARDLSVHMFGPEEGESLAAEFLSELSNMFMGALKASLGVDGLPFTGGLPAPVAGELVLRPTESYKIQESFVLTAASARVVVHLGVVGKNNLLLNAGALREGMILVKDVFNPKGILLLKTGTRLSLNMIEKLRGALPPKQQLEIAAP